MLNATILTWLTFLPALGAVVVLLLPRRGRIPQVFTLALTLLLFIMALHLPVHFDYTQQGFQYELNVPWIASPAVHYHVGVDGLSMWLVVLVSFLAPLGVLISWRTIEDRTNEFYSLFLLQQTAMYGVFIALDLILYYAFWELSIVPLALLIGMYGRTNGRTAGIKFFLYAFISSALFLVGIIWLYSRTGTFDFVQLQPEIQRLSTGPHAAGVWLASLAFLVAFAVKAPVFPLHGWLKDGISEAPTAVAMILAGKLGLYSLLRWHISLFPVQATHVAPLMISLAVISILYGALLALVQTDLKRVAAYATLSAVGFAVLGIYAFTPASMAGGAYQILNESISGGALFMLLGILYERYGTFELAYFGGIASKMPKLAVLFVITALSLIGLPGLNNFAGEFLILSGSFQSHPALTSVATLGVIFSAAYMLRVVQSVFYGAPSSHVAAIVRDDLSWRERAALWPPIVLMICMGVASAIWLHAINLSVPAMTPMTTASHNISYATMGETR